MKFGVCLPNYGPATSREGITQIAQKAEDAGYDSVWATDHVVVPEKHGATFGHVIEALTTLAYLAGVTSRIRLATSILVLPQRDPILTARQVAAIDQLSNGRTILGIGVGWIKEEYQFLRSDFSRRGRMANEWIDVMRTLWTDDRPSFHGTWISFDKVVFEPKPVQPSGPPIYVGGNSNAAIYRAATLGDGWHPDGVAPNDLAIGIAKLSRWAGKRSVTVSLRSQVAIDGESNTYLTSAGSEHHRIGGTATAIIDQVGEYAEAGLEYLICQFTHQTTDELLFQLEAFAATIMPVFRGG